jgi:hypothetical protein
MRKSEIAEILKKSVIEEAGADNIGRAIGAKKRSNKEILDDTITRLKQTCLWVFVIGLITLCLLWVGLSLFSFVPEFIDKIENLLGYFIAAAFGFLIDIVIKKK